VRYCAFTAGPEGSRIGCGAACACAPANAEREAVTLFALALKFEATIDDFAGMHHAFPTFGEGVKAAAEQAMPEMATMAEVRA